MSSSYYEMIVITEYLFIPRIHVVHFICSLRSSLV